MPLPDTVIVHRVQSPFEAEVVAGLLQQAGIPAQISGAHPLERLNLFRKKKRRDTIEIRVPSARAEEAKEVIEAAREAGQGDGFDEGE